MANKSSFTQDQWNKIIQAPLLVGFAVAACDPSGLIGTLQEGKASAESLANAGAAEADGLIKAVVDELLTPEGRTATREGVRLLIQGAEHQEIKTRSLEDLRNAAQIVDAVAPLAARPFKDWLNHIAATVAEAGHEGGFLGFGGEKVSAAERTTLSEISVALGL